MTSRRRFIQIIPIAGASLLVARTASAQLVSEKDPQAAALGYVADATKADKAKYKNYAAGQLCTNCALFQGKADRRRWRLPAICRQASCRQGLVQRLRQEGGLTLRPRPARVAAGAPE